jgi:Icc-related predicted phosphoesterase
MLKANLFSDLHVEHRKGEISSIRPILDKVEKAPLCILAGDILSFDLAEDLIFEIFDYFRDNYDQVIYVPGNHEHYGCSPLEVEDQLLNLEEKFSNIKVLRNDFFEYGGQRFFGGTMWFHNKHVMHTIMKRRLNDFRWILNFEPWVYETNQAFMEAAQAIESTDVIVTHHLPSYQSVPEEYRQDNLNIFYVNDCEKLIERVQPKLWVHGHTHSQNDYQIGDTRIVSNPLGYPGARSGYWFRKDLILDL